MTTGSCSGSSAAGGIWAGTFVAANLRPPEPTSSLRYQPRRQDGFAKRAIEQPLPMF